MLPPIPAPPSLEKFAYDSIKKAILEFRLKPGDSLVETDLSKHLGISKTPIRDALSRLENEGFVTKVTYTGTYVSPIDNRLVTEIFELRAVLEGLAARKAATSFTAQDIDTAETILNNHSKALAEGELASASHLNRQFHNLILRGASNQRLTGILSNLEDHLQRFRVLSNYQRGKQVKSVQEHKKVLDAIREKNPDAAEQVMRLHLNNVVSDLKDVDIDALIQRINKENPAGIPAEQYNE